MTIVRFEPGVIYKCRSPANYERIRFFTCWRRTATTVSFASEGKEYRCAVRLIEDVEVAVPFGCRSYAAQMPRADTPNGRAPR